MNNTEKQRAINKIKRCLALSKSSNENEAATALRQAHTMMLKYQISAEDIRLSDICFSKSDVRVAQRPVLYQSKLSDIIAHIFSCKRYITANDSGTKAVYCFVGDEMYATIASYAFDVLSRQLKKARLNYMKTELKRVRVQKNKIARADAFCYGWCIQVEELIKNIVPPTVDMLLVEQAMDQQVCLTQVKPIARFKKNKSITTDFINGWIEGQNAQLHNAMNGKSEQALLK